ncbi:MAG: hypothetical protein ACI9CF_001435, partial [Candidatus Omnitrophota bacterium]
NNTDIEPHAEHTIRKKRLAMNLPSNNSHTTEHLTRRIYVTVQK